MERPTFYSGRQSAQIKFSAMVIYGAPLELARKARINVLVRARMKEETRITVRLEGALLRKLDDLRRVEIDVPGRSEMMRRLIERAEIAPEKRKAGP